MTRLIEEEEAFKVLSAYYKHSTPVQDSALHDALSRVPSADLVNEWCTDCKEYDQTQHCCHRFTKVIRQAQEELKQNAVPVKRGKWIIRDNPGTGWYRVTCSECGEDVTANAPCIGFFPNAKVIWNYCPECGADMRGEE